MKNRNDKYYAAIDLGTNSCRLVIANQKGEYVFKDTVATKLGEGMFARNCLTEEAMERSLECFYRFKQTMDKYGVDADNTRAIATASCRLSSNAEEFIGRVYAETMIKLDIVDGFEEARLNMIGAKENIKSTAKYILLVDIGGGSTEISLAVNNKNPEVIHTVSIPWGARNAHEAFELTEYDEEKAEKLRKEIKRWVDGFITESHFDKYKDSIVTVATSSTPLRLASMVEKIGKYDRDKADGILVKMSDAEAEIAKLYNMTREEMSKNKYIGEKRSYIFISASIIFKTIAEGLGINKFTASLKSAKDGIIKELINNDKSSKISK